MSPEDQAFLEAMIKHHEAAIAMAREYLNKVSPTKRQARISDLARNIITAQTAENTTINKWLTGTRTKSDSKTSPGTSMNM